MKKVFLAFTAFVSIVGAVYSQQKADSLKLVKLEEVVVSATRVSRGAPIGYSDLSEVEIKKENAAKNIPYILQTLPSVVSYTEGGTAVGNTALRIRGTDASRINVTLNGMPLNNPESQEVYWVNLPDISNSLQSLQVQRGVGTSTNGTASFGASISMQTAGGKGNKPYADLSSAYGQYNTLLLTGAVGTGVLKNGLSVDARYSYIKSDGYIRNGKVDHKNVYAAVSHYSDKQLIRLIYMNGIQHTGITWLGVDPSKIDSDRRYNGAGEYKDDNGKTRYYDNETDNYYSNIGQLIYSRYLTNNLTLNANLSYNNGYGYYENYKTDEDFSDYGLSNQTIGGTSYENSDLILRKLMQNDFYVGGFNFDYKTNKLGLTAGAMYSYYDGHHYGRLLWVKHNQNIANDYEWNRNKAVKQDINAFFKAEYRPIDNLSLFAEVQERYIDYRMHGLDDDLADLTNKNYYNFINPKGGLSFRFNNYNEIYGSFGISNREPLRADLKESLKGGGARNITSERLYDYELGYKYANSIVSFSANFYYMDYKDQLVQTGKLNDIGYKLQENVPDSYRTGIELSLAYTPTEWLRLDGNLTLSRNKIKNYTAYFTIYDPNTWKPVSPQQQETEYYKSTDISFSPNTVGSFSVTFKPFEKEDFTLSFINKYVGKMYYDNTSNPDNRLQDYFITDMVASYTLDANKIGKFDFQFFINNLASIKYSANAWVDPYRFSDGTEMVYRGVYPQAGANLMGEDPISLLIRIFCGVPSSHTIIGTPLFFYHMDVVWNFMENNWISIIGAVIGLIFLYLEYKANVWMWAASIVMAAFYIYIFYKTQLYASMGIYIYFFMASVYGWIMWVVSNRDDSSGHEIITHIQRRYILPVILAVFFVSILIYYVLSWFNGNMFYITIGDSVTTSLNIVALWMISRKWAEQWLLVIPANLISSILLFAQHDIMSGCLFAIFFIVSIFGYINWKKMIISS